jgi:hypothetical protein
VIIDLTPVLEGTGRARLLDLVSGRSAAALKTWLSAQTAAFREQAEVVAMDGFGGYKGTVNLRSCRRSANHISLIRHTRSGKSRRQPAKIALGLLNLTVPLEGLANLSIASHGETRPWDKQREHGQPGSPNQPPHGFGVHAVV